MTSPAADRDAHAVTRQFPRSSGQAWLLGLFVGCGPFLMWMASGHGYVDTTLLSVILVPLVTGILLAISPVTRRLAKRILIGWCISPVVLALLLFAMVEGRP